MTAKRRATTLPRDIDGVPLTPRQAEVLDQLAQRPEPKHREIAERLGIETKSVDNLVQQIRERFGLSDRQNIDVVVDRYRRATRPRGIAKRDPARESVEDGILRRGTLVLCEYVDEPFRMFMCDPTARIRAIWDPDEERALSRLKVFRLQAPLELLQTSGELLGLTLPSNWVEDEWKVETSDPAQDSCIWWRVKIEVAHDFVDAVDGKPIVGVVDRILIDGSVEVNCPAYDEYLHVEYPVYRDLITTLRSAASTFATMNDEQLRSWISEQYEGLNNSSYHRSLRGESELLAVVLGLRTRGHYLARDHTG